MRTTVLCLSLSLLAPASAALAQPQMTPAERATAVSRARELAGCLDRNHNEMQRVMRLLVAAERQRDTSGDPAAQRDAEAAIEALMVRVNRVQRDATGCIGTRVPQPGATVIERPPPPDAAADSVAGTDGSIQAVERDAQLSEYIRVVVGQQVDGSGHLEAHEVRGAVRRASARLARCYEQYLDRGSMEAHHLDLVFTFSGSGGVRGVTVENSDFADAPIERCVRAAGGAIRAPRGPSGGSAQFSYRLRFGRPPR